jgi:hypothetical protein
MSAKPALLMGTLVAILITLSRLGNGEAAPTAQPLAAMPMATAPLVTAPLVTAPLVTAPLVTAPLASTASPAPTVKPAPASYSLEELLAALRLVETGGLKHEGRHATGDGGKALGPYQIHRAYWKDSGLAGSHEDCRDPAYAREVVQAYWRRYCPRELAEGNLEVLARVHNGGPEGHKKSATLRFWRKVEAELQKARAKAELKAPAAPRAPRARAKAEPAFC